MDSFLLSARVRAADARTSDEPNERAVDEMSEECAICFDAVAKQDALRLPCECRVIYCMQCWDRALATSFNDCGYARCPTCRSPVRVDFDGARLQFSSEPYTPDINDEAFSESVSQTVNRLAEQAAPLMARMLRAYGEAHPTLRALAQDTGLLSTRSVRELKSLVVGIGGDPAGCFEKSDLIERLRDKAGGAAPLSAYCAAADATLDAAAATPSLRCVCQGELVRMAGRDRCRQLVFSEREYTELAAGQLEALLDLQLASGASFVICDLCDDHVPPRDAVYTCGNGQRTILHPTTYDVCNSCFVRYAVHGLGDDGLALERQEM